MHSLALFLTLPIAAAQPGATSSCGAEHRSLDYLIGEWRVVHTASGKDFAQNRVEPIHGGCGVRENLRMRDGSLGTATNFFSPSDRLWHTFYHDTTGFHAHLTGITDSAGRQELSADVWFLHGEARPRKARQVVSKDGAGRPRQVGYVLNDDLSWQKVYDVTFCPANQEQGDRKSPC